MLGCKFCPLFEKIFPPKDGGTSVGLVRNFGECSVVVLLLQTVLVVVLHVIKTFFIELIL